MHLQRRLGAKVTTRDFQFGSPRPPNTRHSPVVRQGANGSTAKSIGMADARGQKVWRAAVLAVLLAGCGSDDRPDIASESTDARLRATEVEVAEGRTPALGELAIAALDPSALPGDVDVALGLLHDLPDEIVGLPRMADETAGEVRYGIEGQLVVAVMEASDMGVSDETNAELLAIEARRQGRTVTAQETDQAAPLLYLAGTEGTPPIHFLLWTTADNRLIFAAGADSAENLEALLLAFAETAA